MSPMLDVHVEGYKDPGCGYETEHDTMTRFVLGSLILNRRSKYVYREKSLQNVPDVYAKVATKPLCRIRGIREAKVMTRRTRS